MALWGDTWAGSGTRSCKQRPRAMLRLLDHPCFWCGVHHVQGMVTDTHHSQTHSQPSPSFPSSHTAKAILHSIRAPSMHSSLSKLTHRDKHYDVVPIWTPHVLSSSGALPQGQTSVAEPQQHPRSLQLSSGLVWQVSCPLCLAGWGAVSSLHQAQDHLQLTAPCQPCPGTRGTWTALTHWNTCWKLSSTYCLSTELVTFDVYVKTEYTYMWAIQNVSQLQWQ